MALPSEILNQINKDAREKIKRLPANNTFDIGYLEGYESGYIAGATEYAEWKLKYDELKAEDEELKADFKQRGVVINNRKRSYETLEQQHAALKDRAQKLVDALNAVVKQWQNQYDAECGQADWYNNNMPGVGQTLDYKSRPAIPEWVNSARLALSEWNEGKDFIRLNCMGCGNDFYGPEPKMCCDGRECGCMGQPVEPVVCSQECYDKVVNRGKEGKV